MTLVVRLRDPADAAAWREFDTRYRELIVRFLCRRGLQRADAEDSAQSVISKLVTGLRNFQYDPVKGGFRAYLFRCARSALSDHMTRQARAPRVVSMADGQGQPPSRAALSDDPMYLEFEREWVDHHYRLAVARYKGSADERAAALLDAALAGIAPRLIAEKQGISENAVHKAMQRLRDRLRDLIEEQVHDEETGDDRPA